MINRRDPRILFDKTEAWVPAIALAIEIQSEHDRPCSSHLDKRPKVGDVYPENDAEDGLQVFLNSGDDFYNVILTLKNSDIPEEFWNDIRQVPVVLAIHVEGGGVWILCDAHGHHFRGRLPLNSAIDAAKINSVQPNNSLTFYGINYDGIVKTMKRGVVLHCFWENLAAALKFAFPLGLVDGNYGPCYEEIEKKTDKSTMFAVAISEDLTLWI